MGTLLRLRVHAATPLPPLPGVPDLCSQARPPLLLRRRMRRLAQPTAFHRLLGLGRAGRHLRFGPRRALLVLSPVAAHGGL